MNLSIVKDVTRHHCERIVKILDFLLWYFKKEYLVGQVKAGREKLFFWLW